MFRKTVSALILFLLVVSTLTLAFGIQPVKAQPTTITVPDDYPTIQGAINAASDGDTVYVRNGFYEEHIEIDKTIKLTGESDQNTIIIADSGSVGCGIDITASNVTVENFNITSGIGPLGAGVIFVGNLNENVYSSNDVIKNNNIATSVTDAGDTLDMMHANGNIVEGNHIVIGNETSDGIGVMSSDNTVCNNTVIGGWTCISVMVGDDNNVSNNLVSNQTLSGGFSDMGAIALLQTSTDTVVGNTLISNELGLSVAFGKDCSVYHNNFINNTQQVLTENGSQVLFDDDYPSGGNYWGDYAGTDIYSGVYQNQTGSDGIGDTPYVIDANNLDNYPLVHPYGSICNLNTNLSYLTIQEAINNANNGDTIFVRNGIYYENVVVNKSVSLIGEKRDNTIINGNQSVEDNFAFLINRTNGVVVQGFTMQNCKSGVFLLESDYCRISNNRVLNCTWEGVWVYGSHDDFVDSNFFNTSYWGVYIVGESDTNNNNNIVFSNIFDSNSMGAVGIVLSTNDTVSSNLITKNSIGIDILTDAYDNLIIANTLQDNGIGLSFYLSDNETLYHNNFLNNTANVDNSPKHNKWDNGYPSGGNYWSDYNGTDSFKGPYQNLTGSDGIGDTPYTIDANNTDNYPLMNPWSGHDVAVTDVLLPKTVVGVGYGLNLTVTAADLGSYPETFNVTVYANPTNIAITVIFNIASQSIALSSGNSASISFVWNTTGFVYGNYTLSAYAAPVLGETNTSNNNFPGGWVIVSIPGDIAGNNGLPDGKVDMKDIATVAAFFMSKLGDNNWKPNADINNDMKIDMKDIAIAAAHFGQHYP